MYARDTEERLSRTLRKLGIRDVKVEAAKGKGKFLIRGWIASEDERMVQAVAMTVPGVRKVTIMVEDVSWLRAVTR